MKTEQSAVIMEEVSDSGELAKARSQRKAFDRNAAWLQRHISEVYSRHRGRCICVAGQEFFVAETAQDAIALARAAHPEDDGWFTRYIPKEKMARVYAL